jgi:hypothetical protein
MDGGSKSTAPPPLQRGVSKRAVLIPQVTNLKFELNDLEALANIPDNGGGLHGLKPKKSAHRLKSLHLKTDKSLENLSSLHITNSQSTSQRNSVTNLNGEEAKSEEDFFIDQFLENVPKVNLTKEDSKLIRTRVIEEMYRIQERAKITPEERQRLFQIAVSMDAPKLARKLVSETKDRFDDSAEIGNGNAGAFLTGNLIEQNSRNRQLDDQESNEVDEDELFCKAFDEVERIRKRILQRASKASLSPVNRHQQDLHNFQDTDLPLDEVKNKEEEDNNSVFEKIKIQKKPSFRSNSTAATTNNNNSNNTNNQKRSPKRVNRKIYPDQAPPSSSSNQVLSPVPANVSRPSSYPAPNSLNHSNSSHNSHKSNNHSSENGNFQASTSLDDSDLNITRVLDTLLGSNANSQQSSQRGLGSQTNSAEKKSPMNKGTRKDRSMKDLLGDDADDDGAKQLHAPHHQHHHHHDGDDHSSVSSGGKDPKSFSFYDPFLRADRKNFKMDSSLLKSAENELKMVQEKLAKFDNVDDLHNNNGDFFSNKLDSYPERRPPPMLQKRNSTQLNQNHPSSTSFSHPPTFSTGKLILFLSYFSYYFSSHIESSSVSKLFISSENSLNKFDEKSTISSDDFHHQFSLLSDNPSSPEFRKMSSSHAILPSSDLSPAYPEPQPQAQPQTSQTSCPSNRLPPLMKPSNIKSDTPQTNSATITPSTHNSTQSAPVPGSKTHARLMVASPLTDWIQLGINLDQSHRPGSSSASTAPMNNINSFDNENASTLNRQNSGFLLDNTNQHHMNATITPSNGEFLKPSSTGVGTHSNKFFNESNNSLRRSSDSPLVLNGMDLLKQHQDTDAFNKAKKSLLLLNTQIAHLHSPTNKASPKSPLHNLSSGPRISSVSSNSAPPSTRHSDPLVPIPQHIPLTTRASTKNRPEVSDELSALLENDLSLDAEEALLSPPHLQPPKRQVSMKKGFVSQSVDETWKTSNPSGSSSMVSQSMNEPSMVAAFERPSSRGHVITGSSNLIGQSPRRTGSSGNILKAGGLSLMRENSQKALQPIEMSEELAGPSVSSKVSSKISQAPPPSRVSALAAALNAGDAVGKLMAEMITNSKKHT